jgi:hypothetical protein
MQKSCKIKSLEDCSKFQIVKGAMLKLYYELCKRMSTVWEIDFHFLVRISIRFVEEIERKQTTIDMCVSRREMRKDLLKNEG